MYLCIFYLPLARQDPSRPRERHNKPSEANLAIYVLRIIYVFIYVLSPPS